MTKNIFYRGLACIALLSGLTTAAKVDLDRYHSEIIDFSIDENLQHPEIPKRKTELARSAMVYLSRTFQSKGMDTDLSEREGLVLIVTLPASELFAANDTIVMPAASKWLADLATPLQTPDKYKMLIAVHSDNTGSEEYLYGLTRARADALVRWFGAAGVSTDGIVPYGLGFDEPLNSESSRKGRAANRRVEFYYVPGPMMFEDLKSKK